MYLSTCKGKKSIELFSLQNCKLSALVLFNISNSANILLIEREMMTLFGSF